MKRLTVVLTTCMILLISWQAKAQLKVNPQIGVNVSALDAKIGDLKTEAKAGWNAGVDFRLGEGFIYLSPGAHYYRNTARLLRDLDNPDIDMWKGETTIQSIKTPINLGFKKLGVLDSIQHNLKSLVFCDGRIEISLKLLPYITKLLNLSYTVAKPFQLLKVKRAIVSSKVL